jgi:predicted methyltransferase
MEKGRTVNSLLKKTALVACSFMLAGTALAIAPDFMEKLSADSRPMEDKVRDGARRPYQIMQLLGVEEGMTVMDIGAGGGWYTRVLSAAVGPSGHVISQFGPRALERENGRAQRDLAASLGNTEASFENLGDMDANIVDVAVTALNIHHGNDERNIPYFRDVMHVLKPGGVAAIIDHVGLESIDNSRLHRIPPAQVRAQIEAAGLEIVAESDILHTTADDHTMSVSDPALGRNVDRFVFIVRKPN